MKRSIILSLAAVAAISLQANTPACRLRAARASRSTGVAAQSRPPVLVELFTSEGCSDCPPADALLARLDQSQPVPGAEAIVLSEHVDYWNHLGWRDPYSSHEYSERQSAYAARFGLDSVYTPQMVVDGESEMVGSDRSRVLAAIAKAADGPAIPVTLSAVQREGRSIVAHIEAGRTGRPASPVNVYAALADDSDASTVSAGENAGRTLIHIAVLRSLVRVGSLDSSGKFSGDVKLPVIKENDGGMRLIVFLQEESAGRVWGVMVAHVPR
jgi:hypothetical protein